MIPDVETLLNLQGRTGVSLLLLLWLYLDPFSLFKDSSRGNRFERAAAERYNVEHRQILLPYVPRWVILAAVSIGAVFLSEFTSLTLLAAFFGLAFSVAVAITVLTLTTYLLLGR